jgi:putative spermidine/putrescine transport system substrate-binding protein
MGIVWTGRAYSAISQGADLGFTWNDAGYTNAYYAIPKGAPNKAAGEAFLAMNLVDTKGVIALTNKIPYPTPLKALSPSDFDPKVGPYVPAGANLANAYAEDEDYYAKNIDAIVKQFNQWVTQ